MNDFKSYQRGVWKQNGRHGEPEATDYATLAKFIPQSPDKAITEMAQRLREGDYETLPDFSEESLSDMARQIKSAAAEDPAAMEDALRQIHEAWESNDGQPHPLRPLTIAWWERPRAVRPDESKPTIIFPQIMSRGAIALDGPIAIEADTEFPLGQIDSHQMALLSDYERGQIQWSPAFSIIDAMGMTPPNRGRGARMDKRLLIYSLASIPESERRGGGRFQMPVSLRTLAKAWLYPSSEDRESAYRPNKHAKPIRQALNRLTLTGILMPDGREWRPVMVRVLPNFDNLDSEAVFDIDLPDSSGPGPIIDRKPLYLAGAKSDPAFDLEINLAFYWDRAKVSNGGTRIYATRPEAVRDALGNLLDREGNLILTQRGRPIKNWNHPRAILTGNHERHPQANRVPLLNTSEIHALAFNPNRQVSPQQIRKETTNVRRILRELRDAGRIVIESVNGQPVIGTRFPKHIRVLEVYPERDSR